MTIFTRILLGFDALIALVVFAFFFVGLGDGTVSSFNILIWIAMVGGVLAVVGGGLILAMQGQRGAAIGVLLILAIPGALALFFLLMVLILQPRWN